MITSENNAHNQVLTTIVRGAGRHALVTLSEDGSNIDVSIADRGIEMMKRLKPVVQEPTLFH